MLKKIMFFFVLSMFFVFSTVAQTDWQLVWQDEFDGTDLDLSKWTRGIGSDGLQNNNELQYYTDRVENSYLQDGKLVLKAIKETYTGPDGQTREYTSGRIWTKGKASWTYGRIEARIKLTDGTQGIWPAFWLLPEDNKYGTWPKSGEIDIMEFVGKGPTEIFGTLQYGAMWPGNDWSKHDALVSTTLSSEYHDYAIEWDYNEIRWYFDGQLWQTQNRESIAPYFWSFQEDFYVIFNVAVGGYWPGAPDDTSVFPQTMDVEYVRVFERNDSFDVDGPTFITAPENGVVYSTDIAAESYTWQVPRGMTIVSGQGTDSITVNVSGGSRELVRCTAVTSTGETVTLAHGVFAKVVETTVFDDYQGLRRITYKEPELGSDRMQETTNPAPDSVNGSDTVLSYQRDDLSPYDTIRLTPHMNINASGFNDGTAIFYLDIYTNDIPVGTPVNIKLEDSSRSNLDYPAGRHATYLVKTTKQGGWETLAFEFNTRDDAYRTTVFDVDEIVIMVDPGNMTGYTMYFDNFRFDKEVRTYKDIETVLDYDSVNKMQYKKTSAGVYTDSVPNPAPGSKNSSAKTGRFERSTAEKYDSVSFTGLNLDLTTDSPVYMSGLRKFAIDVYTEAPAGTKISVSLEHNEQRDNPETDIDGINTDYQMLTTTSGEWETLILDYNNWYDWPIENYGMDQITITFDPGNETGHTYYIDNFRIMEAEFTTGGDPRLDRLEITPHNPPALKPGETIRFSATGYDQFGNVYPTTTAWTATGGMISETGLFTATEEGTFTITASAEGITVPVTVTVGPVPVLTTVEISPKTASLKPGEQVQFSARGFDQNGNDFPAVFTWTLSGGGTLDLTRTFTAGDTPGSYTLTASAQGKNDTAAITIGEESQVVWAINCGGGSYTAQDGTVYGADEGFDGGFTASTAHAIANSSDDPLCQSERWGNFGYSKTLENGTYDIYFMFAETYWNAAGDRVFDVLIENEVKIPNLDIYARAGHDVCYPVSVKNVTVTDGSLDISVNISADQAKFSAIMVKKAGTSPVLTTIEITPETAALTTGETRQFIARAFDQFGAAYQTVFDWTTTGGTITTGGLYTATRNGGPFTVTASAEGISKSAQVTVLESPVLTRIEISPDPVSLQAGENVQFTAAGYDQFDNPYQTTFGWTATGGTVTTNGLYTAGQTAGTFSVTASAEGINESVTVTIQNDQEVVWAVNCGGGAYTAQDGTVYAADEAFTGGYTASTTDLISGTTDAALYQTERWGNFGYQKNLPNGTYEITFQFAETYWNAAGDRVFSVNAENVQVIENLDIYAREGHDRAYDVVVSNVTVTDGKLDISVSISSDQAKFSAIKVKGTEVQNPVLTAITVTPGSVSLKTGETGQFNAVGYDQFGAVYPATFSWSATGGPVTSSGLYTAGNTAGTFSVTASAEGVNASAQVTVIPESTGFTYTGTLPNGLVDGQQVSYRAKASFDGTNVTVTLETTASLTQVFLFTPGWNGMENINGVWTKVLSGYQTGDTLQWYYTAIGNGQADNSNRQHSWTIGQ